MRSIFSCFFTSDVRVGCTLPNTALQSVASSNWDLKEEKNERWTPHKERLPISLLWTSTHQFTWPSSFCWLYKNTWSALALSRSDCCNLLLSDHVSHLRTLHWLPIQAHSEYKLSTLVSQFPLIISQLIFLIFMCTLYMYLDILSTHIWTVLFFLCCCFLSWIPCPMKLYTFSWPLHLNPLWRPICLKPQYY